MRTHWIEEQFAYDGSQLRSLFAYESYGLRGDSVVSWIGPCQIPSENIVDVEDLRAGDKIEGSKMLHFVVELFDRELLTMIAFQRLMISVIQDLIGDQVSRSGDDLFFKEGKLSISIATVSPVSGLIHTALNIRNEGTPVKTSCLEDLGLDAKVFAAQVLTALQKEWSDMVLASQKVKWVR